MVYKFECSLDKQDCATLYPGIRTYKLAFTSQSCVRDNRLEGNVGRCGFPGAPCTVDSQGQDDCAGGDTSSLLCQSGACRGEPGAPCSYNNECNWGINCNATRSYNRKGVCGGYGAYMNNLESYDGLDFGRDYCLSGIASQNNIGHWVCSGGPPMALTSPPLPASKNIALIAGVSAAGAVVLAAIIAFVIWRRRRRNRLNKSPVAASVSNEHSSIDEEKIGDTYVPQIQSLPSSGPDAMSESTLPDSPTWTDNPSFSNPMIVPPTPIFPEIQSDDHPGDGNVPIRQTTLATEKRATMARQGPDAPSNENSGFYSSAITGSLNPKLSPNRLYNTTRVPFNQGISVTTDNQSSSNRPYDISPLTKGSKKDG